MTARELLIAVLQKNPPGDLWPLIETGTSIEDIADLILTSRDEETLHSAADDYEALTSQQHPGVIYGAIRRIRAYKVGAFLRARADATGYDRSTL
ncbi:hypothetical protein [Streptomyces sp. NPDC047868]|uniref:hypothetical protein n=1 Tax=Streptomyces sp. NPDC047868 TaxID=3155480 RepID=UPI0034557163